MKSLRHLAVLPLLVASLWAASPAVSTSILPEGIFPELDVILKQAVLQSPVMLNRALDLEIAENNRIAARSNLLPSAGGYFNLNRSKETNDYVYNVPAFNNKTEYWTTQTPFSFSISQPLFHWGERNNLAKIGEIQQSMAKGAYRDGYRMLAQTLRIDYMRLIVLKLSVKRAAFFLEFSKNLLEQEEARLAKKVISEMQIAGIRIQAEQAQIASERTQYDYDMARASFARLSGSPILSDEQIPDTLPTVTYVASDFDQLLAGYIAQKDLPTVEASNARKLLEVEKLNYANIKTRLKPKINLSTGITRNVQSNLYGTVDTYQVTSLYAGIGLNWSIFDGFAARSYARNSLARRRQMETDYKVMTERLGQLAQTQAKQINFTARSMAISDRGLNDARGGLQGRLEEFAQGTVSEVDVSRTRLGVFDAEIYAYNSRIDYLGRIGDFLGTVVEDPVVANLSDN